MIESRTSARQWESFRSALRWYDHRHAPQRLALTRLCLAARRCEWSVQAQLAVNMATRAAETLVPAQRGK